MKTLAAILVQNKKPLILDEIEIPKLCTGQVLVKIFYSGICGTQLNEIDGKKTSLIAKRTNLIAKRTN